MGNFKARTLAREGCFVSFTITLEGRENTGESKRGVASLKKISSPSP
jgi:hypothetical protein